MDEPREVSAPNGARRWIAKDGRSYGSIEEAREATPDVGFEQAAPATAEKATSRLQLLMWSVVFMLLAGGFSILILRAALSGTLELKNELAWIALPFIWFLATGFAIESAGGVHAALTGKHETFEGGRLFGWWTEKLGCGILKLTVVLVGCGVAWLILTKLFEGVSKGTVMVIVLLFGILVALNNIASQKR